MKLHEELRKAISQSGVSVIKGENLLSLLADSKAFDACPAVKDVMKCIATGDCGKKICLAYDRSHEEYLRFADALKESLARDKSFRQDIAGYAVDCISFALGIVSEVTEPDDCGCETVQGGTAGGGSPAACERSNHSQACPAGPKASAPGQSSINASAIFGDSWETASDGAESHRRCYRGHDLTAAFDSGEFSRHVADGTFRDIFPGDGITREMTIYDIKAHDGSEMKYTVKFIIADLDAALNRADSGVTAHHVVIVPETPPFMSFMNHTDTNEGGYAKSCMNEKIMPAFARGLASAFGADHLLKFSFDGSDSAASAPLSCACRLMTLPMVFGQALPEGGLSWSSYNKDSCLGGAQFAAFSLNPDLRGSGMSYWVSDLPSSSCPWSLSGFAQVRDYHGVGAGIFSASRGNFVRPFALLV